MKIPLIDLRRENLPLLPEVFPKLKQLVKESRFVSGKEVKEFEEKFAEYCGVKYACAVNSGTSALILALKACGIGKGDEVITTPFTFIATVEAILWVGAKPVFVDIHPEYLTIDAGKIEDAITSKTRAIIPVHLYGEICDMEKIEEIARRYNLVVIEDAAQAHGAEFVKEGVRKKAGSMGKCGCFSFYPSKNLGGWGEGGMITTDDEEIYNTLLKLRDHGREERYFHTLVGGNFRMENYQALVLSTKLKYLDEWNRKRREKAEFYFQQLRGIKGLTLPFSPPYSKGVFYLYVIRTPFRDKLVEFLHTKGVEARRVYPIPLHLQKALGFLGYGEGDFPVSEKACYEGLALPLFPEIEKEEMEWVVES
ncbi:MAG TPA: DegT/DnrJ/EryC1/StrS family aminotransferase, partial [bacterium]|nr:DegT/DnrJ/EryC1/StrS family aminotransferase [bacterium]HEX67858.1 DegT/DnrJ/EryC1/StrS family aminotransferase [bacterium]